MCEYFSLKAISFWKQFHSHQNKANADNLFPWLCEFFKDSCPVYLCTAYSISVLQNIFECFIVSLAGFFSEVTHGYFTFWETREWVIVRALFPVQRVSSCKLLLNVFIMQRSICWNPVNNTLCKYNFEREGNYRNSIADPVLNVYLQCAQCFDIF